MLSLARPGRVAVVSKTSDCEPMTAFVNAMDAMPIRGENSASELPVKAVGSPLVALFFKLVRGIPASSLQELMASVPTDEPESLADLVVLAYQTRATRGMGKGEKAISTR